MRRFIIGQNTGKALTDDTGLSGGKLALVIASTILGRRNVKNLGGDKPKKVICYQFLGLHTLKMFPQK